MPREEHNPFAGHFKPKGAERLPANIKPIHYALQVMPNLEKATFEGSVVIEFEVIQPTVSIVLHAIDLDITSTALITSSGEHYDIPKVHYHAAEEAIVILLPLTFSAGQKFQLLQNYTGRMSDRTPVGMYRTSYIDHQGNVSWIAATQMEPSSARNLFPCIDEPAAKATFTVSIVADQKLFCASNMDIASSRAISVTNKIVTFNTTPVMSTYLLALVVGDLNVIETNDFHVPIRVIFARNRDPEDCRFALDVAVKAMRAHEDTFGIEYPLPKLDMAAIPGHQGGMENWGLVLYDEKLLVIDEQRTSAASKQLDAVVIVHELAHQWFGNLVTMKWWDDTWLNESFSDWAAFHAVEKIFPEWDVWNDFIAGRVGTIRLGGLQDALDLDANRFSHAIKNPDGPASQNFDAITYQKGCAVLRTISEYLGVDTFISGVRLYLHRHMYGNATTEDLWDALSHVSGVDVAADLGKWISQVGFPVVEVVDEKSSSITLVQHRFLQAGSASREEDRVTYPLYLQIREKTGVDNSTRLFDRFKRIDVDLDFYKLNAGQTVYFRTSYPLSRMHKFGKQLALLPAADRIGLVSDFTALKAAGTGPGRTSDLLTFLLNFKDEKNYFVLRQVLYAIKAVQQAWLFEKPDIVEALARFQNDILRGHVSDQLWNFKPKDGFTEQNFKSLVFTNTTSFPKVQEEAEDLLDLWLGSDGEPTNINPNIRQGVYRVGVNYDSHHSLNGWSSIKQAAFATTSGEERVDFLSALGYNRSPEAIAGTLALYNNPALPLNNSERTLLLRSLLTHTEGVAATWKWLRKNWDKLAETQSTISGFSYLSLIVDALSTWQQFREVDEFFREKDTSKYYQFLDRAKDNLKAKAAWVERDRDDVKNWLAGNGYTDGNGSLTV